jgi:hypothetical protein
MMASIDGFSAQIITISMYAIFKRVLKTIAEGRPPLDLYTGARP